MALAIAPAMAPAIAKPMASGWQTDAPNPNPNPNPSSESCVCLSLDYYKRQSFSYVTRELRTVDA